MGTKIQTALRLDRELLNALKEKAKADKRSLNNYIEYVLFQDIGNIPNTLTEKALKEANSNNNLSPIEDLKAYKQRLLDKAE